MIMKETDKLEKEKAIQELLITLMSAEDSAEKNGWIDSDCLEKELEIYN